MKPVTLKHITPVKRTIIIHKQHIARLHSIRIKYLRHPHLWNTTRSSVPQLPRMIVCVIKPNRQPCYRVPINRTLRSLHRLQPPRLPITLINHLQIHVKLGRHRRIDNVFEPLLDNIWCTRWYVEVGDGDTDLAVIKLLEEGGVEFCEDCGSVSDEETSATFSGFLEAYECCIGGGAFGGRFAVEAYVVPT